MHPVIRILVVDDQSLVRSGLCFSLANLANIEVVGQADSGEEALRLCVQLKPDLVLLDFKLADRDGMDIAPALLEAVPNTKILIVTTSVDSSLIPQLFARGVSGFFNKASSHEELLKAIELVCAGRTYICPHMAKKVHHEWNKPLANPFDLLSERELQVVLLVSHGLAHEEICKKLAISTSTLKTYRVRISEKLHVKNDVELILVATRHGLF